MVIEERIQKPREDEQWDMIIELFNNVFNLKLKDVWQYRSLLSPLIRRYFVSFYKQTIPAPSQFFIQTLLTAVIFTILFSKAT